MTTSWILLLTSAETDNSHSLEVGMAGLYSAVLLCSTTRTACLFISRGGVAALAALLSMPALTPAMARLAACICELVTLSAGAPGCAALMGTPFNSRRSRETAANGVPKADPDAGQPADGPANGSAAAKQEQAPGGTTDTAQPDPEAADHCEGANA